MNEKPKSSPAYHIKKFADGRMTPNEFHRALGIRKKCEYCGQPAVVRLKVLISLKELTQRNPEFVAQIMASNPDGSYTVPTVPTIYGPMVKVTDIGACELCKREAEIAAAKGPSWAIVEIDRGPDPTNRVSLAVPRS